MFIVYTIGLLVLYMETRVSIYVISERLYQKKRWNFCVIIILTMQQFCEVFE